MSQNYILAIDQGTTGSRAFIFNRKGTVVASAYQEFRQYFPKPGWVEHDAQEIWSSCLTVIRSALSKSGIPAKKISAIGITNQRETVVAWDRTTSQPIGRAIVWQCRRTADICQTKELRQFEPEIRRKTGLVVDPYFSGTKIKWMIDHVSGLKTHVRNGRICFGTIDSWLIWKLSAGKAHVTDFTNASRTLLFNIRQRRWDNDILQLLSIPEKTLPDVKPSGSFFAETGESFAGLSRGIPITAVMGDQQAALYGQGCYEPGSIKNTYGTGCFLVLNTGSKFLLSRKGLITTLACDQKGQPIYALEGSIFIAGALIQWLRDQLKFIKTSPESEIMIKGLNDSHGVYIVPAFVGLGAPYWNSEARGIISGLTRGCTPKHIVRAGLESIAYQTKDVFDLMQSEFGQPIRDLRVDGGACRNDFLMKFQSDMIKARVIRPKMIETTAQGAAHLAGVTIGLWDPQRDLRDLHPVDKVFMPTLSPQRRNELYQGWQKAVRQAISS